MTRSTVLNGVPSYTRSIEQVAVVFGCTDEVARAFGISPDRMRELQRSTPDQLQANMEHYRMSWLVASVVLEAQHGILTERDARYRSSSADGKLQEHAINALSVVAAGIAGGFHMCYWFPREAADVFLRLKHALQDRLAANGADVKPGVPSWGPEGGALFFEGPPELGWLSIDVLFAEPHRAKDAYFRLADGKLILEPLPIGNYERIVSRLMPIYEALTTNPGTVYEQYRLLSSLRCTKKATEATASVQPVVR